MTRRRLGLAAGLFALMAVRCNSNGTETDNPGGPEVSFQGSQCAHEGTSHDSGAPPSSTQARGGVGTSMSRLEVAGDYTRLECVAWGRDGGELHVSVRNLRAACGIEWNGAGVLVNGNDVQLEPHNPECMVARCGTCFYDLEFAVNGAPETGDLRLSLRITDVDGTPCNESFPRPMITVAESASDGARCAEVEPMLFQPPPPACERYASCSGPCTCATGTRCVAAAGASGMLCIPECENGDDCPVPGAFACVDGLCKTLSWE